MTKKLIALLAIIFMVLMVAVPSAFAVGDIFSYPRFKAIDGNGNPIRGGKLFTYQVGTSTDKAVYSDSAATVEHTNPVILDSNGEALIYLTGAYKMNLKTRNNGQVPGWPIDNIQGISQQFVRFCYPNSSAADHGVTGNSDTIKYCQDTTIGGTKKGTIYLQHDSGGTNTDYVFSTSETITSNITIQIEPGARLDPDTAKTITANSPEHIIAQPNQQIKTGAGTLAFTNPGAFPVNWFGTDATAIGEAIDAVNGGQLIWLAGTYSPATAISKTLTADQVWIADGPVTVQWAGAANAVMILIEQASFDINIKGPFIFDANASARYPLRLNNTSATMADAARATLTDVWGINAYTTTNSNNAGLAISGGYDYVRIEGGGAINISRAGSLSADTAGIVIAHTSTNAYIRETILVDVEVDTVTSLDDPPVSNMDCVNISGPSASDNSGVKIDSSATIRGGRFINCDGRSIKLQTEFNVVTDATFIRDSTGKITTAGGTEIDFQYGSGVAINNKFWYKELTGSNSPFGASFKVINATVRGFTEEGSLVVKNNIIINEVPSGTDSIPVFVQAADAGGGTFLSIVVDANSQLGGGRVNDWVFGNLEDCKSLRVVGNYSTGLGNSFIRNIADASGCRAQVSYNRIDGTDRVLLQANAGLPVKITEAIGNVGFSNDATIQATGTSGGGLRIESITLIDDDTYIFSSRGHQTGIAQYWISVNSTDKMQGHFAADVDTITDLTGGASTAIDYGSVTDPDAGCTGGIILNVWIDAATDSIAIHNCAGSTRVITLMSLG